MTQLSPFQRSALRRWRRLIGRPSTGYRHIGDRRGRLRFEIVGQALGVMDTTGSGPCGTTGDWTCRPRVWGHAGRGRLSALDRCWMM